MTSAPPSNPGPDHRGLVLDGRYELREVIASGGTAVVYTAQDRVLRRPVVAKVILPEHSRSHEQRQRIRQEAILGAQIAHPHVMPVLDFGVDASSRAEPIYFLVMPQIRGQSLRDLINAGQPPWELAVRLVRQLLAGVAAIHRRGVIHRDIKPDNCLVSDERGRVHLRLLDLGLAKTTGTNPLTTPPHSASGALFGTHLYASPEQIRGEPVDERSDVYSTGVVLYELLVRRPPFVGNHFAVLQGHAFQTPTPPRASAASSELPARLDWIVLKALEKDPARRYSSMEAFDEALVELATEVGLADTESPLRPCPHGHAGCEQALASLSAWSSFEHHRCREEADAAARDNPAWAPLRLLVSLVPD